MKYNDPRKQNRQRQKGRRLLTIGIAALGWQYPSPDERRQGVEPERAIILAADRMLTWGVAEYEQHAETKCYQLTNRILALFSGPGDDLLEVCERTNLAPDAEMSVREAAYLLADKYLEHRTFQRERSVLAPYGLTMESFLKKQREFDRNFLRRLEDQLDTFDRYGEDDGSFILAGVEDSGNADIYTIDPPGLPRSCGHAGFTTIGTGGDFARQYFMSKEYTSHFAWTRSILLTHAAKRKAESAAGVGRATDLWWITKDGIRHFPPGSPLLNHLDKAHHEREEQEIDTIVSDNNLLDTYLDEEDHEHEGPETHA